MYYSMQFDPERLATTCSSILKMKLIFGMGL